MTVSCENGNSPVRGQAVSEKGLKSGRRRRGGGGGGGGEQGVPKLLRIVVGNPSKLVTLKDYLYHVAAFWKKEAGCLVHTLEQANDHPAYRKILSTTWCYPGPLVKPLVPGFTLKQYSTQNHVYSRAVEALICSKGGKKNVLCYGCKHRRGNAHDPSYANNLFSSGVGKVITSPSWEVLLSRIGDTLMLYLMLNLSMFVELENGCYFQLSGHPVTDDARATKRASDALQSKFCLSNRAIKIPQSMPFRSRGAHEGRQEGMTQQVRGSREGPGRQVGPGNDDHAVKRGNGREDGVTGVKPHTVKKCRPSSWQRKKYRKALEAHDEAALRDLGLRRNGDLIKRDSCDFITQQTYPDGHSPLNAPTLPIKTTTKKRKIHYRYPRMTQRPSEMVFWRHSIFYSTRYSRKCGLNSKHILMRLDDSRNSGRVLYQYIFKRWLNPVALKWNHLKCNHLSPIPKHTFVPKKHRYMLPWLTLMSKKAKRCPFGALLQVHCPLPTAFTKGRRKDNPLQEYTSGAQDQKVSKKRTFDATLSDSLDVAQTEGIGRPLKLSTRLGKFLEKARSQVPRSREIETDLSHSDKCNKSMKMSDLSASFVPHSNVAGFVWAVIRHVVPGQLLGGSRARVGLRKAVQKFIGLKRFETMSSHQVLHKIPLSDLTWLDVCPSGIRQGHRAPNCIGRKLELASLWVGWLFSSLVVPVIRSHFYCTENEAYRQEVFYYRKPIWAAMVDETFKDTLSSTFLPVKQQAVKLALEKRKLGVSRLRFLPKRSGLRFLVNMSRDSVARFPAKVKKNKALGTKSVIPPMEKTFSAINKTLKNTLHVLQYEARKNSEAFGSSTYGFNDIFCRFKPFVQKWKADRVKAIANRSGSMQDIIKDYGPHAVCVDVSRAFDNVDVRLLMNIISSLLTADEYTILKFTEIVTVMGAIKVKHRNTAIPSHEVHGTNASHQIAALSNGQKNRIFLDCVTTEKISRSIVIKDLEEYLSMNLVKLKRKWRYQTKGIAQGGKPSTLLCSLYLGYIERVCLEPLISSCGLSCGWNDPESMQNICQSVKDNPTSLTAMGMGVKSRPTVSDQIQAVNSSDTRCPQESHTLLIRLVDDWILISRHRVVAEQFAMRILQGIPGFNIRVNPAKTQITFPLLEVPGIGVLKPNLFEEGDGRRFVKWCGLLVDSQTLELRADYTRYCGEHIGSSLNIPISRKPGATLSSKLCHYIRPKIIPVLLDQEINSPLTIRINVYQTFLLGAMKLHCFVCGLTCPPNKNKSPAWIMSAIETGIRYVIESTRAKTVSRLTRNTNSAFCNPGLPYSHVEYLGLHAFYTVLKRKQTRYPELLQVLSQKINEPRCKKCQPHLQEAIKPMHSAVFDSIIF